MYKQIIIKNGSKINKENMKQEFKNIINTEKPNELIVSLPIGVKYLIDTDFIDEMKNIKLAISKRIIDEDQSDNIYIYIKNDNILSIALDGPSGSGKSTIAKIIASNLNINYLDTGAMYRAITLKLLDNNCKLEDKEKIKKIIDETKLDYIDNILYIDNTKIDSRIRNDEVTKNVSLISSYDFVRDKLLEIQREIANSNSAILDGRDIGTVVLPKANYKFFLTASPEVRAMRRYNQIKDSQSLSYEYILKDIKRRDKFDSERKISPLKKSDNAIEIDSSELNIDEVVDKIIQIISNGEKNDTI